MFGWMFGKKRDKPLKLKVPAADLLPYSRDTWFAFDVCRRWIRIKMFGLWIVHWVRRAKTGGRRVE